MALDKFQPYLFVSAGEQSNKYLTPVISPEGIASFQAQRAQELTGLTVRIDPIQEGTGDPSPTNVRAISGRTGLTVATRGKNLFDKTAVTRSAWLSTTTGEVESAASDYVVSDYILVKKGVTVYIPATGSVRRWFYDINKTPTTYLQNSVSQAYTPTDDGYIRVTINKGIVDIDTLQIEFGTAATAYVPYAGQTYPITWESIAGTVYGGTLDVVSGVLTVTDAQIASYAGETLPGEWISDRDVYVAGTTPTTGAQVVYKLATPQTYRLTGAEVRTIAGYNQVYSDAGPVIDIKF